VKIVFYTDKNFEYMAQYLINSLDIQNVNVELLYYTLGFRSLIDHPNLTKRFFELNENLPRFEFYKPSIFLDVLKDTKDFIFLDSDVIVGKRFDISKFKHYYDYPLASVGNWDFPFVHTGYSDGDYDNIVDESRLMKYFGVKNRTMSYVYSCFMSINDNCIDFLKEWKSFCENSYLLEKRKIYYPFQDETSFNVLMWKRKSIFNYGRIYLNTLFFNPLKFVEECEDYQGNVFNIPVQYCDNSSNVMFYHGLKDKNELEKSLDYLKNVSGGR
jgi:hypothetical protein